MKTYLSDGESIEKLSAGQHLYAAAVAGSASSMVTNPIWVVKTRMFTTPKTSPLAYRNVFDGLYKLAQNEGLRGLFKGSLVSVLSVTTGVVQFVTYEDIKRRRKISIAKSRGQEPGATTIDLSNSEYIVLSGLAKLVALGTTYPYQVVRARIQYAPPPDQAPYTSVMDVIRRTYKNEGPRAFYKGLSTNAVRILPGTCVTFVVYENLTRLLRQAAT